MDEEKEIKKRLTIEISDQEHRDVKSYAALLGMTIKEFIEMLIFDYAKDRRK